jgi:hypothetical protein
MTSGYVSSEGEFAGEVATPPTAAWVRFLRSYGPTPNNLTMFDEYVSNALGRAKVAPITLSTPLLENMARHIESQVPGSLLIAGTAGDGKTYHCRALWARIGGDAKVWATKGNVKELRLQDGRLAVFIKDLSEFNGEESDLPLERLERSVLGGDDSELVVLAANHGQLLDRLRDLGKRQGRPHPLRKPLQERFLQAGPALERLAVFDLSRTTSRKTFDEVASAVARHPEWENCRRCALNAGGKVCPINENRRRLLGESDDGQLARRLGDLVEIARLNGLHLPVRDLLALCSNMVLGYADAKLAKENLMTCSDVPKIQENGHLSKASVYANAFGANLPRRRAYDRPVFKAMASFGVGEETTNAVDGLLVYGKDDSRLQADFERLVAVDTVYGATPEFRAAQDAYLEGSEAARLDGSTEFLELLDGQRRRLYFTLPEPEAGYPRWSMTAFRFAGDYLDLIESLRAKKPASEATRGRIACGLNRVMTGLLLENVDRIFIASSGGFTQSRVSVLCDHETPSRRQGGVGMAIKLDEETGRPQLDVSLSPGPVNSVAFDLTPVRHEFLSRVAEGALPASFSNECLEDLLAFKAKLLRKAEIVRKAGFAGDDDEAAGEALSLTLNLIEIEPGGRGFTRPVTVRFPA